MFAVTGGMGALGVVIELEIQCIDRYNLSKEITIVKIKDDERGTAFPSHYFHYCYFFVGKLLIAFCQTLTSSLETMITSVTIVSIQGR